MQDPHIDQKEIDVIYNGLITGQNPIHNDINLVKGAFYVKHDNQQIINIFHKFNPKSNNELIFELDYIQCQALVNKININYNEPILFLLMLKESISKMKQRGIREVVQQVYKNEWLDILTHIEQFKYINTNDVYGFVNVICDIDNFPCAFMKGIGFE